MNFGLLVIIFWTVCSSFGQLFKLKSIDCVFFFRTLISRSAIVFIALKSNFSAWFIFLPWLRRLFAELSARGLSEKESLESSFLSLFEVLSHTSKLVAANSRCANRVAKPVVNCCQFGAYWELFWSNCIVLSSSVALWLRQMLAFWLISLDSRLIMFFRFLSGFCF